jgi:hypothetical protein
MHPSVRRGGVRPVGSFCAVRGGAPTPADSPGGATGAYHPAMSKREPKPAEPESDEYSRFDRVMTALFRVDKREIPKHEPKRRTPRDSSTNPRSS